VDQDIEILEKAFPHRVEVCRSASSADLREKLIASKPDIVHILLDIDPTNGALIFEYGRTRGIQGFGEGPTPQQDILRVEGFAKLIELSKPLLVVLATCNALYAASKISRFTSVIAASGDIAVDLIVAWQRTFYGSLAGGQSLSDSFELANAMSDASVVLHQKRNFLVTVL
jgi:hypothetical protein